MDSTSLAHNTSTPPGAAGSATPLTAHLATAPHAGGAYMPPKAAHLGRERVKWHAEVWERIDRAVEYEFKRTAVAARFLPHHRIDPHITTVPQDQVLSSINGNPFSLANVLIGGGGGGAGGVGLAVGGAVLPTSLLPNIDEAATTRLVELWVEFSLTAQQVEHENTFKPMQHDHMPDPHGHSHNGSTGQHHGEHHHGGQHHGGPHHDGHHTGHHNKHHPYSTAVTLATRAANILSQAQDSVIFQGQISTGGTPAAPNGGPLFTTLPGFNNSLVANRGVPADFGLLGLGPVGGPFALPATQVVAVPSFPPPAPASNTLQLITFTNTTAATQFTLTYAGNASAPINWSANNAALVGAITNALTAAPINLPAANFVVSPGSLTNGIGTVQVTFLGPLAAAANLITTAVTTPPGTVTAGVPARYVENTVRAITTAYSLLQAAGHYGPYATVLHYYPFADAYAPLPTTLILPADRIKPLMTDGFFGTGTLPGLANALNPPTANSLGAFNPATATAQAMGLVVSLGGRTMDLVIGQEPVTAFSQVDQNGNHLFRVQTRFCVRLMDPSAVIRLEFQ